MTGLTYRQLDYWTRHEIICPSVTPATGSGTVRLYSYGDLVRIAIGKEQLSSGLTLTTVREVMKCTLPEVPSQLAEVYIVISANLIAAPRGTDQLIEVLINSGDLVTIVPVAWVLDRLAAAGA